MTAAAVIDPTLSFRTCHTQSSVALSAGISQFMYGLWTQSGVAGTRNGTKPATVCISSNECNAIMPSSTAGTRSNNIVPEHSSLRHWYVFKGEMARMTAGLFWTVLTRAVATEPTTLGAVPERSEYWPEEWTRHYSIGPIRVVVPQNTPLGVGLRTVDQRCVVTGVAQNGVAEKVRTYCSVGVMSHTRCILQKLTSVFPPCFRVDSNGQTY